VVEYFPGMHEVLGLIPQQCKKKTDTRIMTQNDLGQMSINYSRISQNP
jgi:hypothetical protein